MLPSKLYLVKLNPKLVCSSIRTPKKPKPSRCVSNETPKTLLSVSNKKPLSFYLIYSFSKKSQKCPLAMSSNCAMQLII